LIWLGSELLTVPVTQVLLDVQEEARKQGLYLFRDLKPGYPSCYVTCPFHGDGQERKPSLGICVVEHINEAKVVIQEGQGHCFACGWAGSLVELVAACLGWETRPRRAWEWLTSRYGGGGEKSQRIFPALPERVSKASTHTYLPEETLRAYDFTHSYMYARGLTDTIIDAFRVGYDPETNALTFPVRDMWGRLVSVQRRSVDGKVFHNASGHQKSQYLYAADQVFRHSPRVRVLFLTESILDALTAWKYGQPAVSLMGSSASKAQLRVLYNLHVPIVVLALDNDSAGRRGAARILKDFQRDQIFYAFQYPTGVKDINEMSEDQFRQLQVAPASLSDFSST